jgi:predicted amidophosphoribosyltransferase
MDKRCVECGKPGAVDSGICMMCTAKAMRCGAVMKSHIGRLVQKRCGNVMAKAQDILRR